MTNPDPQTESYQDRSRAASRSSAAALPKRQRARRTNDPFANLARGRRTADLVRAYLVALDDPTDIARQAAVIAPAELQVRAEEARSAALKQGAMGDLDQVVSPTFPTGTPILEFCLQKLNLFKGR